MRPKLIYLVRRPSGVDRDEFIARWRRHGALGMSKPRWVNIARYVHCDVVNFETDSPSMRTDFDGVGLIWHRSPKHRAAHRADAVSQGEMEDDEAKTFSEPIANSCLLAEEHITIARQPRPHAQLKLFRFVKSANGRLDDAASQSIVEHRRKSLGESDLLLGHCVNIPMNPMDEGFRRWGLGYDFVEEFWFEGADGLACFLRASGEDRGLLAIPGVVETRVDAVVTNENLLYDLDLRSKGT